MNARSPRHHEDPATDAAHLITRLAIALLLIGAPIASVGTRRAIYVLVPVGVALTLVAWLLEPGGRGPRQLRDAMLSSAGLLLIGLACWAGLSLIWTPFGVGPSERFVKSLTTFLLAASAAALLPERTKTSNLYLLPIGVAAGAIALIAIASFDPRLAGQRSDPEVSVAARAAFGLALLVWPALGALVIREKAAAAVALSIVVVVAELVAGVPLALAATALGALTFAAALSNANATGRTLAVIGAAAFVVSPLIALGLYEAIPARSMPRILISSISWGDILVHDGLHALLGHGFDSARLGVVAGYLHPSTPKSILFEIWFELGVVGAAGAALLWAQVARRAGRASGMLAPYLLSGLVAALVMSAFGLGIAPVWWVTLLALDAFAFALLQHGQARRRRPSASQIPSGAL
ncbi:MAG: hypothetical protein KGM42_19890 [Hyphomicrobiales bacterium]|nr:hypothetical protein [Hyphomicrobiales bacterium]